MRYVFAIILGSHGLIHLMGFIRAFFSTEISKQLLGISKPIGSLWLITFILFIVTTSQFIGNKKWFYLAFIAVLLSQILIIISWKDAKFGTIANLIILIVSTVAIANYNFSKMVKKETIALLQNIDSTDNSVITQNDIKHLPLSVQKWLNTSGVIGKEKVNSVFLKQVGEMKTKPNVKWKPFTAEQYFNVKNSAFIWSVNVDMMPLVFMKGRDQLHNGEGEMLIKLQALIPVVNEGGNEKINSAAMMRFLAEMAWFPSATINDNVIWEGVNETSAKATLRINEESVSGVFTFTSEGDFKSFEGNRYYGVGENSKLANWYIEAIDYNSFDGFRIPSKCKVTWKLPNGDFEWLNLEITDLKYNNSLQVNG